MRFLRELISRSWLLIFGECNALVVCAWDESEILVRKRRIHLPIEARDEGRTLRLGGVDNHHLARKRLGALLQPHFPVRGAFTERIMVGRDAVDHRRSDLIRRLQRIIAFAVRVAPAKQIVERELDSILRVHDFERIAISRRRRGAGVKASCGRIFGKGLTVIEEAALLQVAIEVDDETWLSKLVVSRSIQLDSLPGVADDVDASIRLNLCGLERNEICTHPTERRDSVWVDGLLRLIDDDLWR